MLLTSLPSQPAFRATLSTGSPVDSRDDWVAYCFLTGIGRRTSCALRDRSNPVIDDDEINWTTRKKAIPQASSEAVRRYGSSCWEDDEWQLQQQQQQQQPGRTLALKSFLKPSYRIEFTMRHSQETINTLTHCELNGTIACILRRST